MSIYSREDVLSACLEALGKAKDQLDPEYIAAEVAVRCMLTGAQYEALKQLVESGPIWDGDVISKRARDDLLAMGLASRACVKGEQGFTVANYRGWGVLRAVEFKG